MEEEADEQEQEQEEQEEQAAVRIISLAPLPRSQRDETQAAPDSGSHHLFGAAGRPRSLSRWPGRR